MVRPRANSHICDLEIVRTEADLVLLLPEWEGLWQAAAQARVMQSPHWCLHSWRAIKAIGRSELFVVCARIAGELVGVVPLLVDQQGRATVLVNLGMGYDEFSGVVLRDDVDKAAIMDQFISELVERGDIDKLSIKNLPDESPLSAAMLRRKLTFTRWTKPRSFIEWREGEEWDDYLCRNRSKSSLQNYARRHRKLVRETGAELVRERNPDDIASAVDWIFRTKVEAYKDRGIGAFMTDETHKQFMIDVVSSNDPTNHLAVYSLKTPDKIIAATIVAHGRGMTAGMVVTHDSEYASFSPGRIVAEQMILNAFNAKEVFDLELGDHEWKRPWLTGTSVVRHVDLYLSRRSAILLEPSEFVRKQLGRIQGALAHYARKIWRARHAA